MSNKTVSEILTDLKKSELVDLMPPGVLANNLLVLSAFINQAGMMIVEAEIAYATRWKEIKGDESDKVTDNSMKLEPEYKALQQAKYAEKALIETIRSIKKVLAVKSEEAHGQM